MKLEELAEKLNKVEELKEIDALVEAIDITPENFEEWEKDVHSDKIDKFDMRRLPYLIEKLYQTTDKFKFMLCCMLLEESCSKVPYIRHLEQYPLFAAKFEMLTYTLAIMYANDEHYDVKNGVASDIAKCVSLIILDKDPKFEHFTDKTKEVFIEVIKAKLTDMIEYIQSSEEIDPYVYADMELVIDLACYLKDSGINELVEKIDNLGDVQTAEIFVLKYKAVNNMNISQDKLNKYKNNPEELWRLYQVFEDIDATSPYLDDVTQEQIAKSNMIRWIKHPQELDAMPDKIELLGEFIIEDKKYFAYKFSKEGFLEGKDLISVTGGYPVDKVTTYNSGDTFSKFEAVADDWEKQAKELVGFINDCKKKNTN